MEFEEALRKASGFIKESKAKGYFLCSAFSSITFNPFNKTNEWILHFSGKGSLDCCIKGGEIKVEESQSIGEPAELDVSRIKVPLGRALDSISSVNKNAITILISLHGSPAVWTINFISADMNVTTFDVNAETGNITRKETQSILRR